MTHLKLIPAVFATTSPLWLPWVGRVSDLAAILLPILGCTWMIIQIVGFFIKKRDE